MRKLVLLTAGGLLIFISIGGVVVIGRSLLGESAELAQAPPSGSIESEEVRQVSATEQRIPVSKILPGGTHVFQTFNNCGPASLSMAFSYLGIQHSQQELGQQLRPYQNSQGDNDDKSVTLAELAERARESGLVVYHRPAGEIGMIEQLLAADVPVITRTWLKPNEDIGHYRVIKGYDQQHQSLLQDDSLQGKNLSYRYDEFLSLWQAFNYEFLVMVPVEKEEQVRMILGSRVDEQQAWELALVAANAQLAQNSSDVYAGFNRSVALYHLARYDEAVSAYEQVADRLPSRMLWYQIEPILAYYRLGQTEKVLQLTNQILNNQNQAFSELHYLQSLIYKAEGQTAAAEAALAAANRYNSNSYWKINLDIQ